MNLFKYISFNKLDYIKDILENNTLYFAFPREFKNNDAYDCKTYRITFYREVDCYEYVFDEIIEKNPHQSMFDSYRQYEINIRKHPWFDSKFYNERIEGVNRIFKNSPDEMNLGILCLTIDYKNNKLWYDYCDNFNGVCISLNVETIIHKLMNSPVSAWQEDSSLNYLHKIDYVKNAIEIPYADSKRMDPLEFGIKMVYTKFDKFEYEDERRFIIPQCISQKINFPSELINAVIIGVNASKENREYIFKLHEKRGCDFTIVEQSLDPINT